MLTSIKVKYVQSNWFERALRSTNLRMNFMFLALLTLQLSLLQITVCYYTFYEYWDLSSVVLYVLVFDLAILFCYTRTSVFFLTHEMESFISWWFSPPPSETSSSSNLSGTAICNMCLAPQCLESKSPPFLWGFVMILGSPRWRAQEKLLPQQPLGNLRVPPKFFQDWFGDLWDCWYVDLVILKGEMNRGFSQVTAVQCKNAPKMYCMFWKLVTTSRFKMSCFHIQPFCHVDFMPVINTTGCKWCPDFVFVAIHILVCWMLHATQTSLEQTSKLVSVCMLHIPEMLKRRCRIHVFIGPIAWPLVAGASRCPILKQWKQMFLTHWTKYQWLAKMRPSYLTQV